MSGTIDASPERTTMLSEIASQVVEFLRNDTGVEVFHPTDVTEASLSDAFDRLDAAIGQLNDLASVYAPGAQADVEPLALPVAVLTGEYLCVAAGGVWLEPEDDPDATVWILMPEQAATDLTSAVRISLLSGQPDMAAIMRKLTGQRVHQTPE